MSDQESSSDALRETLLPTAEENGNDESEEYHDDENDTWNDPYYPSSYLEAAEYNVKKILRITFGSFFIRSFWNFSILSIFVLRVWDDHPEYVGFVGATIGLLQTISSVVATWSTRQWFVDLALVRVAGLIGGLATALSFYAVMLIWKLEEENGLSSFRWFLLANALWGISWGVLDEGLPKLLVESAASAAHIDPPPPILTNLKDRYYRMIRRGCFGGPLLILVYFARDSAPAYNVLVWARILVFGALANISLSVALWMLQSMAMDWDDDTSSYSSFGPGDDDSFVERQQDPPPEVLLPTDEDIIDESWEQISTSEAETSDTPLGCCPDNVMIPSMICCADTLSTLAGGLSAWYVPVFLVSHVQVDPVSVLCLCCLIVPLGQTFSPTLAKRVEVSIGPCLACLVMQCSYVVLFLSMLVCQTRRYPECTVGLLYALGGSLTNSTSGISQALLQKYVQEGEEYWLDFAATLQKLLWSCACFVGAFVVRQWGQIADLRWTVILQLLACLPLVILYFLRDPRLEDKTQQDRGEVTNESSLP